MPSQLNERFWAKVKVTDTCWLWTAFHSENGYGRFNVNGRMEYAHRYSYLVANDCIPTGMVIDHICHVKTCVRPSHLRAVTVKQNAENMTNSRADNASSGVRGVTWSKRDQVWRVKVGHNGVSVWGGEFRDVEAAKRAAVDLRNRLFTHNDADRGVVA